MEFNRKFVWRDKTAMILYFVMTFLLMGYVCFTQIVLEPEAKMDMSRYEVLENGWTLFRENGQQQEVSLPNHFDAEVGEILVFSNVIPRNIGDYNAIMILNTGQYFTIYVGDELRYTFDEGDVHAIGKDGPYIYLLAPLEKEDAGKTLRIEYIPVNEADTGRIGGIWLGNETSLLNFLYSSYQLEIEAALVIILVALGCIVISVGVGHYTHRPQPLAFLGFAVCMTAFWLILNSEIGQFWLPNDSSSRNVAYLIVALLPGAYQLYMDSVQQYRYHRVYLCLNVLCSIDFLVVFLLHLMGLYGLSQIFVGSIALCLITAVVVLVTQAIDIKTGDVESYKLVSIGILILTLSIVSQIVFYVLGRVMGFRTGKGIVLIIGLFAMLLCATAETIKGVGNIYRDKIKAMEQIQNFSIEAMETMAKTVDAKDPYTSHHSLRVAEYSVMLARKLGWGEEELKDLYYAALLHDIGKIGVPDAVLNKPSRLTDTEYKIIKSHTTIGSEIMKNVKVLKDADLVALHHHERYDGRGYPAGLAGEEIPLKARLVCIADAFDAMNSKRVYRKKLSWDVIREELVKGRGTQFDPLMLDAFLELFDGGELERMDDTADHTQEARVQQVEWDERDYLSGLLSKEAGERKIIDAIQEDIGCLAFIDLDNLKQIKDNYGHSATDKAVHMLGEMLADLIGEDICCRPGGDEFLYFMKGVGRKQAEEKVKKLLKQFERVKSNESVMEMSSLSIGLCCTTIEDVYQDACAKADKALYYVKHNGKSGYFFYENEALEERSVNKDLTELVAKLQLSGEYSGALGLEYDDFAKVYSFIENLRKRHHIPFHLVMITLEGREEKLYVNEIENAMSCMEQAIKNVIRSEDVCTRYSSMEFLVILLGAQDGDIEGIVDRIFSDYYKHYDNRRLHPMYHTARLDDQEEE